MSDLREEIATGLAALDDLYIRAIQAVLPPNPQFERDRIIRELGNKREIAYLCGALSEGENEAALILGLAGEALAADPNAAIAHLLDEARYYLRTTIEPTWQLDAHTPTIAAAFGYLSISLARRIARATSRGSDEPLADITEPDARALLAGSRVAAETIAIITT